MANQLLTIDMITRSAVELFKNSNAFIQNLNTQYDDQFAKPGMKIGNTLRIRLPNDYTVRTGTAAQPQDTNEQSVTLVLATQKGVDVSFSTEERTMQIDDYEEIVLEPMLNDLAGDVAQTIMQGVEGGVSNFVSNTDGSGAIISPTSRTILDSGALLSKRSARMNGRNLVTDPFTMAAMVSTMQGLFNPVSDISKQYKTGQIYSALNYRWFEDQTVLVHTTGSFSSGGAVSSAGVTGTTVPVSALTGTLNKGDIITIDGVNAVNRVTKATDGVLQQFVITANVASGATSIPIYPAIIPPVGGFPAQYQTVDASPANGAQVRLVNQANEQYRKNIGYTSNAITMATADLVMPKKGVEEAARAVYDGISMRMLTAYTAGTDQLLTRLDVLFGYLFIRPEWCVAIADQVT